jgi:hypothetical protein
MAADSPLNLLSKLATDSVPAIVIQRDAAVTPGACYLDETSAGL